MLFYKFFFLHVLNRQNTPEFPWLPLPKFRRELSDDVVQARHQVPVVILMSAAIDACALRLQLRYVEE